jgi:hypothetical protein
MGWFECAIYRTATLIAPAQGMEKRRLMSADAFTTADQISIGTAARIVGSGDMPGRAFWRPAPLQVNRARVKLRRCRGRRVTRVRDRPWTATIWLLRAAQLRSVLTRYRPNPWTPVLNYRA